jgi:hypothetical protein
MKLFCDDTGASPARLLLRVLAACPCFGFATLQLVDRIGENVVVTETRVHVCEEGSGAAFSLQLQLQA